jgi:hypothetical protein
MDCLKPYSSIFSFLCHSFDRRNFFFPQKLIQQWFIKRQNRKEEQRDRVLKLSKMLLKLIEREEKVFRGWKWFNKFFYRG